MANEILGIDSSLLRQALAKAATRVIRGVAYLLRLTQGNLYLHQLTIMH
ncbi:MAG TPA: hypothetical protein VLM80_05505 [Anaerolineales bacterium]|nr:hypothetical protein [Anaerolineales bacterium]